MKLKQKIAFYNVMISVIIFDIIYLVVWVFSIEMTPLKAIIAAGLTILLTPWARAKKSESGRNVTIRSFAYILYIKRHKQIRKSKNLIQKMQTYGYRKTV